MLTIAGFAKQTAAAVALTVMFMLVVSGARAQDTLRIALFKTASEDSSLQTLASAIDPVLLSELGNVPNLQIAARPALDLPSMQLAIDCVGETEPCLSLAAKQAEADGLIAPAVRKLGSEVVVTVLLHDARKKMSIKGATRRYQGDKIDDQVLDGIPGMVRELFAMETVATPVAAANAAPLDSVTSPIDSAPPMAAAQPPPMLPMVLAASGVAFIAAGVVLGAVSKSGENAYKKFVPKDDGNDSPEMSALHKYNTARTEAALADVGFGVGAAALAAGVITFIVQQHGSGERDAAQTSARLHLAVQPGRLALTGHWD